MLTRQPYVSGPWRHAAQQATTHLSLEDTTMLQLAIACLVIALLAAILGFGGIAGSFVGVAKILFIVFLVLAVLSFLFGGFRRGRNWG